MVVGAAGRTAGRPPGREFEPWMKHGRGARPPHACVPASTPHRHKTQDLPVSVKKTVLLREPLPCSPAAETALQQLIRWSER